MKAMRLHAINDFRLEEVEKPQPRGKRNPDQSWSLWNLWIRYSASI